MTDATNSNTSTTSTPTQEAPERVSVQVGRGLSGAVDFNYTSEQPAAEAGKAEATPTVGEEPKLILGKFKTQEAFEKSYKEMESKLGKLMGTDQKTSEPAAKEEPTKTEEAAKTEDASATKKDDPAATDKDQEQAKIEEAVANLDPAPFEQEFMEKGALSEESYADLAKRGIPKDLVDDFIALRMNKAEQVKSVVYEAAGGEDNLNSIMEWARSSQEIRDTVGKAYDAQLDKAKTPEELALAVSGLRAQYEKANGVRPARVVGSEGSVVVSKDGGYATEGDWRIDVRSQRYKTDASFRNQVNARLAASSSWFSQ